VNNRSLTVAALCALTLAGCGTGLPSSTLHGAGFDPLPTVGHAVPAKKRGPRVISCKKIHHPGIGG